MPQPTGAELDRIRARRQELRERYLRPLAERPASTVQGVHHLALICKDTEETIEFYQEFLGFPLVELVENRDYAGSNHFFFVASNWSEEMEIARCCTAPIVSMNGGRS